MSISMGGKWRRERTGRRCKAREMYLDLLSGEICDEHNIWHMISPGTQELGWELFYIKKRKKKSKYNKKFLLLFPEGPHIIKSKWIKVG